MNWITNLRIKQLCARRDQLLAHVRHQNADLDTYRREVSELTKLKNGFASENASLRNRLAKALQENLGLTRELDERGAEIASLRAINGALVAENDNLLRERLPETAARPGFAIYPPHEKGGSR